LQAVAAGRVDLDEAMDTLRWSPFEELDGEVRVDHHRELRSGVPEVVLGQWKSAEQIIRILSALAERGRGALATRVSPDKAAEVLAALPQALHHETARAVVLPGAPVRAAGGEPERAPVAVVAAGTSDMPVAEEAAVTLDFLGHRVARVYDVGVAGVHRLIAEAGRLRRAAVVIVVAGMEGALPSVVAGLIDRPIIAVPTSVGYGVSAGGFAALLGMLSSCSPGVTVVNIDNGFGAAAAAVRILGSTASAGAGDDREEEPEHG
jgi:hypothetical protein